MKNVTLLPNERIDEVNENLSLIQKKDGLTFGTDAFLLASFIKSAPSKKAAELGAGTGIISRLLQFGEELFGEDELYKFTTQKLERIHHMDGVIDQFSEEIKLLQKEIDRITEKKANTELSRIRLYWDAIDEIVEQIFNATVANW